MLNYTILKEVFGNITIPLLVLIIVYYVYNYVQQINSYPRGPFPLPIIGNILLFRTPITDIPPVFKFVEMTKMYGQVFTLWIGSSPLIVVNNYELSYETNIIRKNDFIDRDDSILNRISKNGFENVLASSGPAWDALKKVAKLASRKFANNEKLSQLLNSVADDVIELMLNEKQFFNPFKYTDLMIYNNIASIAYGRKYSLDDKEFLDGKRVNEVFYEILGNGLVSDYIPWLRPFYYQNELKAIETMKASFKITSKHFFEHKKSITKGITRDLIDCVLEAKAEAINKNSERAKYYTDDNLIMVVSDLFIAGTDTTLLTLRWILLILGNYPEIQERISNEIRENIGTDSLTMEDIDSLPYTYAFVLEVLRYRVPAPIGIEHTNTINTELNGFKIPKNTRVIFNLYAQNHDPNYWHEPHIFNPNRFLDPITGELMKNRPKSSTTFGLGRRACPGEKLAKNNLVITVVRLIQSIRIELMGGGHSADLIPKNILIGFHPKDYKIICHTRK